MLYPPCLSSKYVTNSELGTGDVMEALTWWKDKHSWIFASQLLIECVPRAMRAQRREYLTVPGLDEGIGLVGRGMLELGIENNRNWVGRKWLKHLPGKGKNFT